VVSSTAVRPDASSMMMPLARGTGARSFLENTTRGGSWTEYFGSGINASLNRTRVIDGKLQLDIDPTILTKYTGNPVLTPSLGKFDSSQMRMNSVLYENGIFKMWYAGFDSANYRTGYATSMDGINWTKQNSGNPVLGLGGVGTWDSNLVAVGAVINDGGTYKMWYSGQNGVNTQVGLATSSDGITWTKYANNPVMKISAGTFYSNHIGPGSSVIKEGKTYKMWFNGNNGNGNNGAHIGYATSTDGIAWTINANSLLGAGKVGAFDSTAVGYPDVWKAGDRYYMNYAGWNGANFRLGAAESSDGINWKRMNNGNAVINLGGGGAWDNTHILESSVVRLGYRTYLWYGGCTATCRIGLATADSFFTEGFAFSQTINLPKDMKWDDVSIKKAEPAGTSVKISVVDPVTNTSFNGFDNLTTSSVNLSSIDSTAHKSIRLIAYLKGTTSTTPSLYMWGVCWREQNTWRDTFIGSSKVSSIDNVKTRLWSDKVILDTDPLSWTRDAANPVLTYGTAGQWDDIMVYDPSFMSKGGTNYLYYVGGTAPTEKIGYASAPDLKTYTKYASNPVLTASLGKFDSMGVRDPDVQYIDSTSKMYYAGRGASTGINFAVTSNMNAWTKYDPGPGFIPSGAGWDKGMVRDPSVMRVNNTYYMWYAGNSTAFELWRIGLAKSYDNGFFWTRPANNEVLDVGAGNKFDDMALRSPSVIFDKDRYLMFYVGKDVTNGIGKIGLANSTDGVTWTRMNNGNAIISPGAGWDSTHIVSVVAAVVNGNYELYYAADGGTGNLKIGHATSGRYTSATVVSKEIVLPPNGLWNGVFINKSEPSGTYINVSVLNSTTDNPIPGFSALTSGQINISTIGAGTKIKLKATIEGDGKATPTLFDWSVNWTIAKVVQTKDIPDKTFPEEGTALNLYDLSQYFTHKRFSNKTLNYNISQDSDPVHIKASISADKYHMDFNAPVVNWTGGAQYVIKVSDGYMNLSSNKFWVNVTNVNDPPVWSKVPDKHIQEDTPVKNLINLVNYVIDSDNLPKDETYSVYDPDPTNLTATVNVNKNLDVSPGENWTGSVVLKLTVNDGQYSANTTVTIIVDPVEDQPVWKLFGPFHLTEDTPEVRIMNLETMAKDAETPSNLLTYSVVGTPDTVLAVIGPDHWLSLYPAANYTGTCLLQFFVNDGHFNVSLSVQAIVDPVNDPPFWKPMPVFNISEDSKAVNVLNLESWVVDAETPASVLIYSVANVSPSTATASMDANHYLIITPGPDFNGFIFVNVTASDGKLVTGKMITIYVIPVNDPPVITSTPVNKGRVTEPYAYQVWAFDIDGDVLTYSLDSFISGMTVGTKTGLISWTPTDTQSGSFEVKVRVSDGKSSAVQDYYIDVAPKTSSNNNPPVIVSSPITDAVVGLSYSYKVEASDADGDHLSFSLLKKEAGMTIDAQTGLLSWSPPDGSVGAHAVVLAVTDGKAQVTQSFEIDVHPRGTLINHPPVITSTPGTKSIVDQAYKYYVVATDSDGNTLHYFLELSVSGMVMDKNTGVLSWTPTSGDIGEHQVVIRVTDGKSNVSQAFRLAVTTGNHAPSIVSTAPDKATVGKRYTYQVQATDLDTGDTMAYGLDSGPQGMTVNPTTGTIDWVPTTKDIGKSTVKVYVSDGLVRVNQSFEVTVSPKATTTSTIGLFSILLIVGIIIAIVVVALLVSFRKGKRDERAMPGEGPVTEGKARGLTREKGYGEMEERISPTTRPVPGPGKMAPTVQVVETIDIDKLEEDEAPPKKETVREDIIPSAIKDEKKVTPKEVSKGPSEGRTTNDILDDILGKVDTAPSKQQQEKVIGASEIPVARPKPAEQGTAQPLKQKKVVLKKKDPSS